MKYEINSKNNINTGKDRNNVYIKTNSPTSDTEVHLEPCQISKIFTASAVNYFRKKIHLRYLARF